MILYCTDAQVLGLLPSNVANSAMLATAPLRQTNLLVPAKEWCDSVYPGVAPFSGVGTNSPSGWQVNQPDHRVGDSAVTIDQGSGDPAIDEQFQAPGDDHIYTITSYTSNVIAYTPTAKTAFADNAPLMIGTPSVVQQAAMWYAASIGWDFIRNNPEDLQARAALSRARGLLGVRPRGSKATAKPWAGSTFNAAQVNVSEA